MPHPTNNWREEVQIEKAYPEAYRLARRFHNLYEELPTSPAIKEISN